MRLRVIILAALLTVAGIVFGQTTDDEWKLLYDRVLPCRASNHYMVVNGPFVGLVTSDGEEIITPGTYDFVYDINLPDYVWMSKGGRYGAYNVQTRKEAIPCQYDEDGVFVYELYDYNEDTKTFSKKPVRDYCQVVKNGMRGLYNVKLGKEVIPCDYYGIMKDQIVDDLCIVFNLPTVKDVTEDFTALAAEGIYDMKQHKQLTPLKYGYIPLQEFETKDYCRVEMRKDPTLSMSEDGIGLIDRQGNELISPQSTYLMRLDSFNDNSDIFIVGKGGRYGATSIGTVDLAPTSDSYALYDAGKKTYLTGYDFKLITPLEEGPRAAEFGIDEGLTSFCTNDDMWGFMDAKGKIVIPAEYEKVTKFEQGVAQVTKGGVTSVLTNPLKGTTLKVASGSEQGKDVDSKVPQTGKKDDNLFAYVFANERYAHLKGADYAINDGKVFAEYCKKTIGVPEKQVHYYEDATYGNLSTAINQMKDVAEVYEGEAKIIFYFAGLGATDHQTKERYLLPSDATLETVSSTGYSITELQKALNDMNTVYTLAILDAPFSNVDRNGNMLGSGRGVKIAPKKISEQGNAIICTSSTGDEAAYASKDYGHGLFTFGILQQLQSTKGSDSLKDLIDGASQWTSKEALKLYDQKQTPLQTVSAEMEEKWQNIKF